MMQQPHSPEPWRVERRGTEDWFYAILDATGKEVIRVAGSTPGDDPGTVDMTQADAERIVACVNACAGASNQELKERRAGR